MGGLNQVPLRRRRSPLTPHRAFSAIGRLRLERLYRFRGGWLLGHRFLRLTHVGRRSGESHRTVLEVLRYDGDHREAVVASGLGRESDWYQNVRRRPEAEVAIGTERFCVVAREVPEDEAVAVLADYEHRNRWIAPIIRRGFSWLVGWGYDSTPAARRRLVRQLPLVALIGRDPDGDSSGR